MSPPPFALVFPKVQLPNLISLPNRLHKHDNPNAIKCTQFLRMFSMREVTRHGPNRGFSTAAINQHSLQL